MIRIIDGKRYNTETAACVFDWTNGKYVSDFQYENFTLYLTKSGIWFFAKTGGYNSGYQRGIIEPINAETAFQWLQSNSDDEYAIAELEKHFGDRISDA